MAGIQDPPAADVPEDGPWTPPGMSPLKKVGLTLLMVVLGVVPGLMLLASDPLPDSSEETGTPETLPPGEAVHSREQPPEDGAVPPDELPPPETPAFPDFEDGDDEQDDEDDDGRDDRPRRGRQDATGGRTIDHEVDSDVDQDADPDDDRADDADDDGPWISIRLGARD